MENWTDIFVKGYLIQRAILIGSHCTDLDYLLICFLEFRLVIPTGTLNITNNKSHLEYLSSFAFYFGHTLYKISFVDLYRCFPMYIGDLLDNGFCEFGGNFSRLLLYV